MTYFDDIKGFLKSLFREPEASGLIYEKILETNRIRLKYGVWVMIFFSVFTLVSDLLTQNFWSTCQWRAFFALDIVFALVSFLLLGYFFGLLPQKQHKTRIFGRFVVHFVPFFLLLWAGLISGIEATNSNGFPTFIFMIFVLSTLLYFRCKTELLFFGISLVGLVLAASLCHSIDKELLKAFYPLPPIVFLAFFISRISFRLKYRDLTTRQKLEIANKALEKSKQELDQKVKTRTFELQQMNRHLQRAKEKAEENDRLKSSFLSNMSHEIRTPLNGIIGFADMLNDKNIDEERRSYFIQIINDSSVRLLSVVNDILDISKIETGQMELSISKVCINEVLRQQFSFFEAMAKKKNVSLAQQAALPDAQSHIFTDADKLHRILNNLIGNALKFTKEGSVRFGYQAEPETLHFFVQDSGIGIDPKLHEKIFERFRQAENSISRAYGGTGLGLSICKSYVELLGGKIWIVSQPQEGATFHFTLPRKTQNPITN